MKIQLNPEAAFREVAGEVFIVTADRAMHQFTTPTALAVFHQLRAAPATLEDLAAEIARGFDVETDQALADMGRFVSALVDRHIAVPSPEEAGA